MKYLILIALALTLTACSATDKYRAQQESAIAQQEAARADQMAQQARMIEAQTQASMMETLADATKPTYWPIIAVVVIFAGMMLLFMRWHMVTVSHIATQTPMAADTLRLLPGEVSFGKMRIEARRQGYDLEVNRGSYFLVDSDGNRQRIKALIERGEG